MKTFDEEQLALVSIGAIVIVVLAVYLFGDAKTSSTGEANPIWESIGIGIFGAIILITLAILAAPLGL